MDNPLDNTTIINGDNTNILLNKDNTIMVTESLLNNKKTSLLNELTHLTSLLKSKEKEIFGDLFRDSSYDEYKRLTSPEKSLEFQNLKGKLKSKIRILEGEIEDLEEQRDEFLKEKNKIDLKIKDLNPEIDTEIMKYDFLLEKKKGEVEGAIKDFNLINEIYKEKINLKKKLDLDFINLELNKNKLEEELEEKIRFGELEEH
ncbi:Chromosome segregation protein [Nosema bombycis CQ1]|uniref:Chromosome segregation protein n=1 Tax=Nosema bombycis (strain CQ1 / CVCC 102059) TaxID=578461 RepID=R0MK94_NOSB1|nr:Chromosome segregation protein [Nosema bombycis CQ1]|eukprot:EOB14665.1 Chromosome segregation protein [Nosema bombycis CQ1]